MPLPELEAHLHRWAEAGLLDAEQARRIAAFETARAPARGFRWPIAVALAAGALMLGAGVLLFVAAHWGSLSPAARFGLVLLLVGGFHLGGAAVGVQFPALARALHAVGTAALGAGIFLAGQIFNLQSDWPAGIFVWAVGAWIGWLLLRDWPQAMLAAILTLAWLVGEWTLAWQRAGGRGEALPVAGLLLLSLVYLLSEDPRRRSLVRSAGSADSRSFPSPWC